MLLNRVFNIFLILFSAYLYADVAPNQLPASIANTELQAFSANAVKVQQTINLLLSLTQQHLNYHYGSADPRQGGMDCSGTIFYILTQMQIHDVPRSADLQYDWVTTHGHFYPVPVSTTSIAADEFCHLHPGDLLFWSGTYPIERQNTITHVMMYLGKNQAGQPLMAGSSNGRTYQGRKIDGVSVFDFKVPDHETHGHFLGYSCTPQLNC